MKDIQKKIHTVVPWYSIVPLVLAFSFNMAVYGGARIIAGEWHHYNIEGTLDRMIPFLPVSAVVYIGCYLFWIANYILIARQEKKQVCQFFAADFISRIVCFIIFLLLYINKKNAEIENLDMSMAYGYACGSQNEQDIEKLYQLADNRMYQHKEKMKKAGLAAAR